MVVAAEPPVVETTTEPEAESEPVADEGEGEVTPDLVLTGLLQSVEDDGLARIDDDGQDAAFDVGALTLESRRQERSSTSDASDTDVTTRATPAVTEAPAAPSLIADAFTSVADMVRPEVILQRMTDVTRNLSDQLAASTPQVQVTMGVRGSGLRSPRRRLHRLDRPWWLPRRQHALRRPRHPPARSSTGARPHWW